MEFVPCGPSLAEKPHALVNGTARAGSRILLSNWPGVATPRAYLGETTQETVFNFLDSRAGQQTLAELSAVSSPEFSAGGLLAIWSLLHPDEARTHRELILRLARAAEYDVSDGLEPTAFVCTVNAYLDPVDTPLGSGQAGLTDEERVALLIGSLLPQIGGMLANIRAFDLLWFGEYSDVLQSDALLNSGAVQLELFPDVDLAVLDTPLRLHPIVKYTASAGSSRLLTVRSENTYTFEYRRESWVRRPGPRLPGRVPLGGLASRLNMFERRAGTWRADVVDAPRARLFFDRGDGQPAPSSIDRETLVAEVADYLREQGRDSAELWTPR